jgi:hypothetical protein
MVPGMQMCTLKTVCVFSAQKGRVSEKRDTEQGTRLKATDEGLTALLVERPVALSYAHRLGRLSLRLTTAVGRQAFSSSHAHRTPLVDSTRGQSVSGGKENLISVPCARI